MKKYILFSIAVLINTCILAQDKVGYRVDKYYYAPLNAEIASLKTWLTDSIFLKNLHPNAGGFSKNVNIEFTDIASKIVRDESIEYLLHIECYNGTRAGISLQFNLGKHDTLFFETTTKKILYKLTNKDSCNDKGGCHFDNYWSRSYGNQMIVRFKTDTLNNNESKIMIKRVHYTFVEDILKSPKENKVIKADDPYDCAYAPCFSDYQTWGNEHTAVIQFDCYFNDQINHIEYFLYATGFIINTSTNYDMNTSNVPYVLTCQHFLTPMVDLGIINSIEDAFSGWHIKNNFKKQRRSCEDPDMISDHGIWPKFTVIEKGNYILNDPNYYDEDYIFLQFDDEYNIEYFATDNIGFVGWDRRIYSSIDLLDMVPFINFSYPHPDGIISDELSYAYANFSPIISDDLYDFRWDEGFTTKGSSGSPIFDKTHNLTAMQILGEYADCNFSRPAASGLRFSTIWQNANLSNYLGSAEFIYTWDPTYTNLREHCSNCFQDVDLGEWGVDCGGPCKPCNPVHSDETLYISNPSDPPEYATSNNDIIIRSKHPDFPIVFNKNTIYSAKNEIELYSSEVPLGTSLVLNAGVNSPIILERDCEEQCGIEFETLVYWGGWFAFHHKNVVHYEYTLTEGYWMHEIDGGEGNVYRDGWIDIANSDNWDLHHNTMYVIYYEIILTDCLGITEDYLGFFHVYPPS